MKKVTQMETVLDYLLTHGELTTRQAVIDLNIMCLPKRIEELRKEGVQIITTYRISANGKRYGVYTLAD
jgi:hypothetical protein